LYTDSIAWSDGISMKFLSVMSIYQNFPTFSTQAPPSNFHCPSSVL